MATPLIYNAALAGIKLLLAIRKTVIAMAATKIKRIIQALPIILVAEINYTPNNIENQAII